MSEYDVTYLNEAKKFIITKEHIKIGEDITIPTCQKEYILFFNPVEVGIIKLVLKEAKYEVKFPNDEKMFEALKYLYEGAAYEESPEQVAEDVSLNDKFTFYFDHYQYSKIKELLPEKVKELTEFLCENQEIFVPATILEFMIHDNDNNERKLMRDTKYFNGRLEQLKYLLRTLERHDFGRLTEWIIPFDPVIMDVPTLFAASFRDETYCHFKLVRHVYSVNEEIMVCPVHQCLRYLASEHSIEENKKIQLFIYEKSTCSIDKWLPLLEPISKMLLDEVIKFPFCGFVPEKFVKPLGFELVKEFAGVGKTSWVSLVKNVKTNEEFVLKAPNILSSEDEYEEQHGFSVIWRNLGISNLESILQPVPYPNMFVLFQSFVPGKTLKIMMREIGDTIFSEPKYRDPLARDIDILLTQGYFIHGFNYENLMWENEEWVMIDCDKIINREELNPEELWDVYEKEIMTKWPRREEYIFKNAIEDFCKHIRDNILPNVTRKRTVFTDKMDHEINILNEHNMEKYGI